MLAIKGLVRIHSPQIFFLEETMMDGDKVVKLIKDSLPNWEFFALDVSSRFGGLISRWLKDVLKLLFAWSIELGLATEFHSLDLKMSKNCLNLYGPYIYMKESCEITTKNPHTIWSDYYWRRSKLHFGVI